MLLTLHKLYSITGDMNILQQSCSESSIGVVFFCCKKYKILDFKMLQVFFWKLKERARAYILWVIYVATVCHYLLTSNKMMRSVSNVKTWQFCCCLEIMLNLNLKSGWKWWTSALCLQSFSEKQVEKSLPKLSKRHVRALTKLQHILLKKPA